MKNKYTKEFRFSENLTPEQEVFIDKFSKLYIVDDFTRNKKIIRYILRKIYEKKVHSLTPIDYESLTIEHLVPQSIINDIFTKNLVGQIGNLILVSKEVQDKLKNKNLKEKIKILAELNIDILCNKIIQLFQNNEINENEFIEKRTKDIAQVA